MKKFKSTFLSKIKRPDTFSRDVANLSRIDSTIFKSICDNEQLFSSGTILEQKQLLKISRESGYTMSELAALIGLAGAIAVHAKQEDEKLEDIIEDLSSAEKMESKAKECLTANLSVFSVTCADRLFHEAKLSNSLENTFPAMSHIHTKCSYVAIFENEYNVSEDDYNTYVPGKVTFTPVCVVQVDIDKFGSEESFSFGLDMSGLERLIRRFQLAKKQLEVLVEYNSKEKNEQGKVY